MRSRFKSDTRKAGLALAALALASALWLPCLHLFFRKPLSNFYQENGISPKARQLVARHLQPWTEPASRQAELKKMRSSNAEWDFMGRSFLVWSLVNIGLREPQTKDQYLPVIDRIIQETVKIEQEDAIYVFLMPYAKDRQYRVKPARSLFLDGELALMMAARRMLQEHLAYKQPMADRLTDEAWKALVRRDAPSLPEWTAGFSTR